MAIRIEIHGVQHPYRLCMLCNDALGNNCITIEPGAKNSRDIFACNDDLGNLLKDFGDGIIRRIQEEREEHGTD
jgi:hypothetical protein